MGNEGWVTAHYRSPIAHHPSLITITASMDILYLLIPLSVVLAFVIGAAFWWSVGSGQFDDLDGPSHRILQDDDDPPQ